MRRKLILYKKFVIICIEVEEKSFMHPQNPREKGDFYTMPYTTYAN